jgi:hypothetical protein
MKAEMTITQHGSSLKESVLSAITQSDFPQNSGKVDTKYKWFVWSMPSQEEEGWEAWGLVLCQAWHEVGHIGHNLIGKGETDTLDDAKQQVDQALNNQLRIR